ncbi:MAG: 2Fe-2S iron-sulfur cluster-binding protein, partial [Candidatus Adiutrix sp.]
MSHHKPDPNKSVNLTIDGIAVTVPEGTSILEAAKKLMLIFLFFVITPICICGPFAG